MMTAMITATVPWIDLGPIGPVDLVQLRPGLADESATASLLVLDRCRRGRRRAACDRGLRHPARLARRLVAGGAARVAPLPAGLVGHV